MAHQVCLSCINYGRCCQPQACTLTSSPSCSDASLRWHCTSHAPRHPCRWGHAEQEAKERPTLERAAVAAGAETAHGAGGGIQPWWAPVGGVCQHPAIPTGHPSWCPAPAWAVRSPRTRGQQTRSWCLRHWSTNVKQPEQVMAQFLWRSQGAFSMFMDWLLQCRQQQTGLAQPRPEQARGTCSMRRAGWICSWVPNLASW